MQIKRRRPRRQAWVGGLVGAVMLFALQAPAAASENYQLFRLDTSFHFAYGHGPGNYGGGLFLEPKFTILDQLVVGALVGVSIYGGGSIDTPGTAGAGTPISTSMSVGVVVPFLAKAE